MNNKEYFNNIAKDWDNISYHDEIKLNKIMQLSNIKEKSKILDIGSGTGVMIKHLLKTKPSKITAIDVSEKMLEISMDKYKNEKIEYICGDVLELKLEKYDYALMYSVYPHIENKKLLFKKLSKTLNKKGKIIIAHSQSKEKINAIHQKREEVKEDRLKPAIETSKIMSEFFNIIECIDNEEMYFIMGEKI